MKIIAFDYKIYEEVKSIRKEIREDRAYNNLMQMMSVDEDGNP